MTHKTQTTVAYLSRDDARGSTIGDALRGIEGLSVSEEQGSFAKINGHSFELANTHDLIIFEAGDDSEEDAKAVAEIRKKCPDGASIFAIASGSASLADVKRLTSAGVEDVLLDSMTQKELSLQIARWREAEIPTFTSVRKSVNEGKVIAVARARGGIGGTTVAVNVADSLLGRTGTFKKASTKKVAIVDFDIQFGTVASLLDLDQNEAVFQMILDGTVPDETFLEQACQTHASGMTVLAAPSSFVPMEALKSEQVIEVIEILRRTHDFVVIDLPRVLVEWLSAVLERTDHLLLVTDSSVPSIHQCKRLIDFYTSDALSLDVQIVVNHETKPVIPRRHITEASRLLDRELKHWLPFDPKAAREASDRGVPLGQSVSGSKLAKSLGKLGRTFSETDRAGASRATNNVKR